MTVVDDKRVEIATDGACKGNPGPGGWGALIRMGTAEKELSGGEALTTNNRMELTAAIEALTEGLRDWDGAVVAVTHNEAFADALEPRFVARVENGGMKSRMVVGGALSKRDFSATAMVSTGGVAGAVREDAGAGAKAKAKAKANEGLSEEEIAAREAEARANAAAVAKMLKEARNAPSVIAKIERALAVIDDDIAAIDERLLACGADVAAAQEIQREKDKKTEKQTLYYEEWERLEAVMEEAKAHGGGA